MEDSVEGVPESESLLPQLSTFPLFPESRVTSHEFSVAFLSLSQRHNLTYASQTDILKPLSILLPTPSGVPSSSHTMTSIFTKYQEETVTQHFCACCTAPLLPRSTCLKPGCTLEQHAVFVHIPLDMQLKERFEGIYIRYTLKWCLHSRPSLPTHPIRRVGNIENGRGSNKSGRGHADPWSVGNFITVTIFLGEIS